MPRQTIQSFTLDGSLHLAAPNDLTPPETLRRNRGIHPLSLRSARSRNGSSLIHAVNAHSIYYYNSLWWYGEGSNFLRQTDVIKSGLNGNRLSFSRMSPTSGKPDWLFVAGSGEIFKSDKDGLTSNWGIDIPGGAPTATAQGAATGSLGEGDYIYQITYYNADSGHRSNGNGTDVTVTCVDTDSVELTNIPASADPQVTHIEIWRSIVGGTTLFRHPTRIANGTATFTDSHADASLFSTTLPTDNHRPYTWFDDCHGPHNASMFWITRTQGGERGRLYYSAIGRPEAMDGFVNVSSDDDPLQKIVSWGGQLGVLSESKAYQIIGTNPYIAREISGIPGTTRPHTVAATPQGIIYESEEGVRVSTESGSQLVAYDSVGRLFRGESAGDLTSFSGIVATYARDEYLICDQTQALAYNFRTERWRDTGLDCSALFYSAEVDIIAGTVSGSVLDVEKDTETTDNTIPIAFRIEPAHIPLDREKIFYVKRLLIDHAPNSQSLTLTPTLDDTDLTATSLTVTSDRVIDEVEIERIAWRIGARITGNTTAPVEVMRAEAVIRELALVINHSNGSIAVSGRRSADKQTLTFELEEESIPLSTRYYTTVKHLFIDADTNSEVITPILGMVGTTHTLGTFVSATRAAEEIPVNRSGRLTQLRLTGDFSQDIKLYRIELDIRTGGMK
jgi:hypothetical protein